MSKQTRPLILITNDDGIASCGLLAAVRCVLDLGDVWVAAPRVQQSGLGRSYPRGEFGVEEATLTIAGIAVPSLALDTSPAKAVRHGILRFVPRQPDLVISGINYGENVGGCITISGTVGAAIEAASLGIPSLAASLETDRQYHYSTSAEIDFGAAACFVHRLARWVLTKGMPPGIDILKLDVPCDATCSTAWRVSRVSRQEYFVSPVSVDERGKKQLLAYVRQIDLDTLEPDSDIHAVAVERIVSVTPLSIDMTAHVDLQDLNNALTQA